MNDLHVTFDGRLFSFAPGSIVKVGRSSDNDVVVNDPTVSRRHAQVSWEAGGWVWQNAGQAPTFLSGQPVARFGVGPLVDVCLAAPQGPALRLQAAPSPDQAPPPTALADQGQGAGATPATNLGAQPGPGFYGDGAQGYPGAPAPVGAGFAGPGGYGGPGGPPGVTPPGGAYPGAVPGPVPDAVPGMPGYLGGGAAQPYPGAGGSFFQTLVPIKSWLHDRSFFTQGIRLLMIPYALLPLIFLGLFSNSSNLQTPGWAYSLYVAPLWLLAFWYLIRPPQIGIREFWIAIFIIVWTVIWLHAVTININDALGGTLNLPKALVVGYNEESTKAIPVLVAAMFMLKVRKVKLDARTWMLMGTVAGLTFGIVEQSIYTPLAIVGIARATTASMAVGDTLLFAFRVFVDGFQHAVWAGISGFFVGVAVNYRKLRIPILLLGVSIPAVLHALNDWTLTIFSTVWVTVLIQALSILLFLGYTIAASSIERNVRRNPTFRGQSIVMERFSSVPPPNS
jgi:RsiW-degrading membrane proteinase PrsW (M82 family)